MKTRTIRGVVVAAGVVTMCTGFLYMYRKGPAGNQDLKPGATTPLAEPCRHAKHRTRHSKDYWSVDGQTPLQMHCNTCALVTSSGQLLGSQWGENIDQAECVVRMNDAPVRGYEREVGRRTSLRVVAHSSVQQVLSNRRELLDYSMDAALLVWGPDNCMRRDGKGHVYNRLRHVARVMPKLRVFTVSQTKMQQFDELFTTETGIDRRHSNTWLSTGWFTMAIAMEICDRIDVYGMVPPDFCTSSRDFWKPYHYYQPSGPSDCTMYLAHERDQHGNHHRFLTEKRVFARWAPTVNIHFHQPEWNPDPPPSLPAPRPGGPCSNSTDLERPAA